MIVNAHFWNASPVSPTIDAQREKLLPIAEQTLRHRTRLPKKKKRRNERKIACKNGMANFYIFFSTMATTMMSSES